MKHVFARYTLGSLCFLVLLGILQGQKPGRITGRVVDTDKNVGLPNANVTIAALDLGTASDENGKFILADLPLGTYRVEASVMGFEKGSVKVEVADSIEIEVLFKLVIKPIYMEGIEIQGLLSSRLSSEKVEVITGKEIAEREVYSLSELLASVPGVDVQTAYAFGRNVNVSIRGSSDYKPGGYNNRVLLLLDGFPILIPNSGAPDWNTVPLENIQRVEVLHGPASALYGQNSMGGVINLITNTSGDSGTPEAAVSFGNYTTKKLDASAGSEWASFKIFADISAVSSKGHRFNANFDLIRFSGRLHRKSDNGDMFSISTILTESLTGHPGFVVPERPTLISYRSSQRSSRYFQAHHRTIISEGLSWSNSLAIHSFLTDYTDRNDTPENVREGDNRYDDMSFALRSEFLLTQMSKVIIIAGFEGSYDLTDVTVMNPIYGSPTQQTTSPFVQTRTLLNKEWSLVSGLRYDYRRIDPDNDYVYRSFQAVSPKLSLSYREPATRLFHISVNKGFRAPSISELYLLHASSYGLFLQGTPTLNPETVWALETGYKREYSPELNWKIQFFHNRYRDMIDFVYAVPVKARNWQSVTASGMEFQVNARLTEKIHTRADYSYLFMQNLSGSEPLLYRPKHKLNGTISVHIKKLSANLTSRFVSRQQYEDFLSHNYEFAGDLVRFPLLWLPERFLLDANLKTSFKNFDLSLKLKNLKNLDYELIQNYPMPGRSWMLTLSTKQ